MGGRRTAPRARDVKRQVGPGVNGVAGPLAEAGRGVLRRAFDGRGEESRYHHVFGRSRT